MFKVILEIQIDIRFKKKLSLIISRTSWNPKAWIELKLKLAPGT